MWYMHPARHRRADCVGSGERQRAGPCSAAVSYFIQCITTDMSVYAVNITSNAVAVIAVVIAVL